MSASIVIAILYGVSHLGIGVALLSGRLWAHTVAIGFYVLQLFRVHTDLLTWDVLSFIGIYATYSDGGNLGINVVLSSLFNIAAGRETHLLIGINVLAIAIVSCLFIARDFRMEVASAA